MTILLLSNSFDLRTVHYLHNSDTVKQHTPGWGCVASQDLLPFRDAIDVLVLGIWVSCDPSASSSRSSCLSTGPNFVHQKDGVEQSNCLKSMGKIR